MSLQRQHFLLSYLKTLSVGPVEVWTYDLPLSSLVLYQLSYPVGGRHLKGEKSIEKPSSGRPKEAAAAEKSWLVQRGFLYSMTIISWLW